MPVPFFIEVVKLKLKLFDFLKVRITFFLDRGTTQGVCRSSMLGVKSTPKIPCALCTLYSHAHILNGDDPYSWT
jgi:hypothetical protein